MIVLCRLVWYTKSKLCCRPAAAGREVLHMKSLLKLLVVITALAGICYLVLSWLDDENATDYISIYGGPEDNQ